MDLGEVSKPERHALAEEIDWTLTLEVREIVAINGGVTYTPNIGSREFLPSRSYDF
jgi:hypothetical protein